MVLTNPIFSSIDFLHSNRMNKFIKLFAVNWNQMTAKLSDTSIFGFIPPNFISESLNYQLKIVTVTILLTNLETMMAMAWLIVGIVPTITVESVTINQITSVVFLNRLFVHHISFTNKLDFVSTSAVNFHIHCLITYYRGHRLGYKNSLPWSI